MSNAVEFRLALSNSYPTGTGSYGYTGSFDIIVQNLAFQKQVSIWAQLGPTWQEIPASWVESLPGNLERWRAPASDGEDQFVAKYTVNGMTYWDNNGGANYRFPRAYDEFNALSGSNYEIVLGSASINAGTLRILAGVQNLAYGKVVGAVFTTDNWNTVSTAYGSYSSTLPSGLEVWQIDAAVGAAAQVQFALFYRVGSGQYWDNNFWRNYTVTPTMPLLARHAGPPDHQSGWLAKPKVQKTVPDLSITSARGAKPKTSPQTPDEPSVLNA